MQLGLLYRYTYRDIRSTRLEQKYLHKNLFFSQEYDSAGVDSPTFIQSPLPRRNSSSSNSSSSSSNSSTSKEGEATGPGANQDLGLISGLSSSRTMLLSHSDSEVSLLGELDDKYDDFDTRPPRASSSNLHNTSMGTHYNTAAKTEGTNSDRLSEVGSISSTSFLSAVSSQEDMALVDLHVHLSKPIIDCPLLLPSYRNHMTQLRCLNWDTGVPVFEDISNLPAGGVFTPTFEKLSEGFTAIRMVDSSEADCGGSLPRGTGGSSGGGGGRGCSACWSPPPGPTSHTPSHPYAWDAPLFTWSDDEEDEEGGNATAEDVVGGCERASTTRTTLVVKLKKDVDIALSPVALESINQFIEVGIIII